MIKYTLKKFDSLSLKYKFSILGGASFLVTWGLISALASGMPKTIELCDDELSPGEKTFGEVFKNGPEMPICTVNSSELYAYETQLPRQYMQHDESIHLEELQQKGKTGKKIQYIFNQTGKLVIDGGLPDNVNIQIKRGKIEIHGDMGHNSKARAILPYKTTTNSYPSICTRVSSSGELKPYPCTKEETVFDRFTYDTDYAPAVHVLGSIFTHSAIDTNAGVQIDGNACSNSIKTSHGRSLTLKGEYIENETASNRCGDERTYKYKEPNRIDPNPFLYN